MIEEEKQRENQDPSAVNSPGTATENSATEGFNPSSSPDGAVTDQESMSTEAAVDTGDREAEAEAGNGELVAQLMQEIGSLKIQFEERNSQYMRIAADFENFRKRTQKEKEDLEQQVKANTLAELLPVVDSFERARNQIKPQTDAEATIHKSYQGVYKQLVDGLKRIGVSPMRPEGKAFDPNLHEAVMREATDEYEEGTVIEELVRGYSLGDRVLRHAMVKVATSPEAGT